MLAVGRFKERGKGNMSWKLLLASASPRRRELLAQIGLDFEVMPAGGEERITCPEPEDIVKELAEGKAGEVFGGLEAGKKEGTVVLGADTIVVHRGRILGKPADERDAEKMLESLCGDTHQVYTGVAFCWLEKGQVRKESFYECTSVEVYPATKEEIGDYIKTGDPMDKAGAYGIQGRFAAYIKKIDGDYNNVVGLPVGRVYQEMKKRGFIQ